MSDIFSRITKKGLTFQSKRGPLSVQQVWRLPLTGEVSLDSISRDLLRTIKGSAEESLVQEVAVTKAQSDDNLRLEVLRSIITEVKADADKRKKAQENRQQRQRIAELVGQKQDAALAGKSEAELTALLAQMDAADVDTDE